MTENKDKFSQLKCATCGKIIYRSFSKFKHSKSGKFFCNKSCQTIWRNKKYSGPEHRLWKGGISNDFYRDKLERDKRKKICVLCKTRDERVLAVHHIDYDHSNNKIENLAYLCHNCHQLVHLDKEEDERLLSLVRV